ncbi:CapA family protein [Natroniella acetigena]|uniref:CapA family protein n=1 Tax=Natroniella acetigena TaxID=52004 RepID=UPI00200B3AA2|nr:CapA family protein [Natroniella acetigena]MCK8827684.1 CapA family protein [Natroniella acetigena]
MEDKIELIAVGDVFLDQYKKNENPFKPVSNYLNDSDILFCNLETCISDSFGTKKEKAVNFKAEEKDLEFLKEENFDIVNIANNHIFDYGKGKG